MLQNMMAQQHEIIHKPLSTKELRVGSGGRVTTFNTNHLKTEN
jgi:hypothetical protein